MSYALPETGYVRLSQIVGNLKADPPYHRLSTQLIERKLRKGYEESAEELALHI